MLRPLRWRCWLFTRRRRQPPTRTSSRTPSHGKRRWPGGRITTARSCWQLSVVRRSGSPPLSDRVLEAFVRDCRRMPVGVSGAALLDAIAPVDRLWVLEANATGRAFYERRQWRWTGESRAGLTRVESPECCTSGTEHYRSPGSAPELRLRGFLRWGSTSMTPATDRPTRAGRPTSPGSRLSLPWSTPPERTSSTSAAAVAPIPAPGTSWVRRR